MVEGTLLVTLQKNVLLNRGLAYQAVNVHLACLSDAVTSVLCLQRHVFCKQHGWAMQIHQDVPFRVDAALMAT